MNKVLGVHDSNSSSRQDRTRAIRWIGGSSTVGPEYSSTISESHTLFVLTPCSLCESVK